MEKSDSVVLPAVLLTQFQNIANCYRLVSTKVRFNPLHSASQTKPKLLSYMPWHTGSIVSVAAPVPGTTGHQYHNIYKGINKKNTELCMLEPAVKTASFEFQDTG